MRPPNDSADHGPPSEPRDRLHGLLGLTSRLSEPLSTDEVARVVVDEAQAAVGSLMAMMWTVDDPPTHATLVRAVGNIADGAERYARIPLEPWLPMGDAMLRREALFFESRAEFRHRYEAAERQVTEQGRSQELSYACLPFVVGGRAIGGVSLVFPHTHAFGEDERMFLTVLAHHAAQALDRARLFEREKRARQQLASLQQITSALSSAATVEAVAMLATRVGAETLALSGAGLWATDDLGDLSLVGEYGMSEESLRVFRRIPIDSTLPAARIARERRVLWCEIEQDLESEDPSIAAALGRGDAFQAYVALPLVLDDRVLGVLAFSAGRPRRFPPEERAFISSVVAHCADAFARARLYDDARNMEPPLPECPRANAHRRLRDAPARQHASVFSNDAVARILAGSIPSPFSREERCSDAEGDVSRTAVSAARWPIPRSSVRSAAKSSTASRRASNAQTGLWRQVTRERRSRTPERMAPSKSPWPPSST